MTLIELKNYAERNNLRIEEEFAQSDRRSTITYDYLIRVELQEFVWYTWMCYDYLPNNDSRIFFRERYNQTNGKSITTIKCGIKTELKIEESITQ